MALGTPTTYHLLLLAQWYVVKPSDEIGSYVSAIFSSWSLGEKNVVCLLRSSMTLTCIFAWMCTTAITTILLSLSISFHIIITIIVTKHFFYYILYKTYQYHLHSSFWSFCITYTLDILLLNFIIDPLYYTFHNDCPTITILLLLLLLLLTTTTTTATTTITFITTPRLLLLLVRHQPSHLVSQAAATHEGIHGPKPEPSATTPHRSVRPNQAPLCLAFLSVRKQGGAWAQGKCVTLTECTL